MYNLKRIKKECFWDYEFDEEELLQIASKGIDVEKSFLFAKIFEHSSDAINDLDIFDEQTKRTLLKNYNLSSFSKSRLQRRYDILKHFILFENNDIKELRWRT